MSTSAPSIVVPFATTAHVRNSCLCLHAQRAARALGRRFDEAMRPLGLTSGQFSLLMALNCPEPAPMAAVARVLAMDRTTLTAALKVLERRGLATVAEDPKDRRGRLLSLTEAGHVSLAAAVPVWREMHAAVEATLAGHDPDALRVSLRALA